MTLRGGRDGFALALDLGMGIASTALVFGGPTDDLGRAVSAEGASGRYGGSYTGAGMVGASALPSAVLNIFFPESLGNSDLRDG